MELQVWRHLPSSDSFHGHQASLGAVDPIFAGLNTVSAEKSSYLAHGEVTRDLEGKDDRYRHTLWLSSE